MPIDFSTAAFNARLTDYLRAVKIGTESPSVMPEWQSFAERCFRNHVSVGDACAEIRRLNLNPPVSQELVNAANAVIGKSPRPGIDPPGLERYKNILRHYGTWSLRKIRIADRPRLLAELIAAITVKAPSPEGPATRYFGLAYGTSISDRWRHAIRTVARCYSTVTVLRDTLRVFNATKLTEIPSENLPAFANAFTRASEVKVDWHANGFTVSRYKYAMEHPDYKPFPTRYVISSEEAEKLVAAFRNNFPHLRGKWLLLTDGLEPVFVVGATNDGRLGNRWAFTITRDGKPWVRRSGAQFVSKDQAITAGHEHLRLSGLRS